MLISIKHGRLGHQVKLAPLSDAAVGRDYVRLPFTGEQLGGAPNVTVGDELTAEQCAAVCALFAVPCQSSGPLVAASLLARRNDEADQARRRADELELTAEDRKREAEEAHHRVATPESNALPDSPTLSGLCTGGHSPRRPADSVAIRLPESIEYYDVALLGRGNPSITSASHSRPVIVGGRPQGERTLPTSNIPVRMSGGLGIGRTRASRAG